MSGNPSVRLCLVLLAVLAFFASSSPSGEHSISIWAWVENGEVFVNTEEAFERKGFDASQTTQA